MTRNDPDTAADPSLVRVILSGRLGYWAARLIARRPWCHLGLILAVSLLCLASLAAGQDTTSTQPVACDQSAIYAPWSSPFFMLIVGILLGGVVRLAVDCILLGLRRRAVGNALLVEVHECGQRAHDNVAAIGGPFLDNLRETYRRFPLRSITELLFVPIDAPLWAASICDLNQIPAKYMAQLNAFFRLCDRFNTRMGFYVSLEKKCIEACRRVDHNEGKSHLWAMIVYADTGQQMAAELVLSSRIRSLAKLPAPSDYKAFYEFSRETKELFKKDQSS